MPTTMTPAGAQATSGRHTRSCKAETSSQRRAGEARDSATRCPVWSARAADTVTCMSSDQVDLRDATRGMMGQLAAARLPLWEAVDRLPENEHNDLRPASCAGRGSEHKLRRRCVTASGSHPGRTGVPRPQDALPHRTTTDRGRTHPRVRSRLPAMRHVPARSGRGLPRVRLRPVPQHASHLRPVPGNQLANNH